MQKKISFKDLIFYGDKFKPHLPMFEEEYNKISDGYDLRNHDKTYVLKYALEILGFKVSGFNFNERQQTLVDNMNTKIYPR